MTVKEILTEWLTDYGKAGGEMKDLTQQEAERCARACGFEFFKKSYGNNDCWGHRLKNGYIHAEFLNLPLDPLFWIGRLWNSAEEKIGKSFLLKKDCDDLYEVQECSPTTFVANTSIGLLGCSNHPCLALCGAIEKLKEKGK